MNIKKLSLLLAVLLLSFFTLPVYADATKVVTIGADLSPEQEQMIWDYFGVKPDTVVTETVNNQEEREYLLGIAPEEQIGTRTYSCAFIEPTTSGGIQVKTANLNWVTADMISSALSTAGIHNANVIAAAPFAVSGTGALTGILKSYQTAANTAIAEDRKEAANQELIATTDLANSLTEQGTDAAEAKNEASTIVNEAKEELFSQKEAGDVTQEDLYNIVQKVGDTLSDTDKQTLLEMLSKINAIDYSEDEIKAILKNINSSLDKLVNGITEQNGFLAGIWSSIQRFFGGGNILDQTNDSVLGAGAILTNTSEKLTESVENVKKTGAWERFTNWLRGLLKSDENEKTQESKSLDEISDKPQVQPDDPQPVISEETTKTESSAQTYDEEQVVEEDPVLESVDTSEQQDFIYE